MSRQFGGRTDDRRRQALLARYGGNRQTEQAVRRGLDWLARRQQPGGRFALQPGGGVSPIATTALAVLAFMGHGVREAVHRSIVEKGLRYLISRQQPDGFIGPRPVPPAARSRHVLGHVLAAHALFEGAVLGLADGAAQKALAWLAPGQLADPRTVTLAGFVVVNAMNAGFEIDAQVVHHCLAWFEKPANRRLFRQHDASRLVFRAGELLLARLAPRDARPAAAPPPVAPLLGEKPGDGGTDLLAWLVASEALRLAGDRTAWSRWNAALVHAVLPQQNAEGRFVWNRSDSPDALQCTALSVLLLEVYYRNGAY